MKSLCIVKLPILYVLQYCKCMLYCNKWLPRKFRACIVYSLSIYIRYLAYVRWENTSMNAAKNKFLSQNQGQGHIQEITQSSN